MFISKMNPSVHTEYLNEGGMKVESGQDVPVIYTAEKGKPILIPEYKFISE